MVDSYMAMSIRLSFPMNAVLSGALKSGQFRLDMHILVYTYVVQFTQKFRFGS